MTVSRTKVRWSFRVALLLALVVLMGAGLFWESLLAGLVVGFCGDVVDFTPLPLGDDELLTLVLGGVGLLPLLTEVPVPPPGLGDTAATG